MNNIEELKKTALAATSGPWFGIDEDWSDGENIQITCESREGVIEIAKVEGGGSESGFSDPFKSEQQANAIFIALANPSALLDLIAQLEAAQKERDDLREKVNQADSEWHKMADRILSAGKRAEKAEAALSAANQPWRSFVTNDDISALNRFAECCDDPESGGHDLDKDQVERLVSIGALRKTKRNYHETTDFGDFVISAGFTVEGEPAPVKYIVILQRAWCNDSGSGINYHSDLIEFDKRDKAIKHGFELQDSDDFNIGVLTNGVLTSFDWMDRPLLQGQHILAVIAEKIGIEGNADAK